MVFGTPAEEKGGGKILMLEKGAFEGVDVCMMCHPSCYGIPDASTLATVSVKIIFKGETKLLKSTYL